MNPEGIAGIGDLVAAAIEARPFQTEVDTRSAFIVHFPLLAHELVLVDEGMSIVAGLWCVCFVAVGV